VLSRFAPQRRDVLVASALDMAWSRELLGVHYPSDSEAGRVLAGEFVRMLFEQADFRQAFDDARQEWPRSGSTY
jgi:acid phosphatase (class A)